MVDSLGRAFGEVTQRYVVGGTISSRPALVSLKHVRNILVKSGVTTIQINDPNQDYGVYESIAQLQNILGIPVGDGSGVTGGGVTNDTLYIVNDGGVSPPDTFLIDLASLADGNGIYDGSGTVPDGTVAAIDSGIVFQGDQTTTLFQIDLDQGLYGTDYTQNDNTAQMLYYDAGGSNKIYVDNAGATMRADGPDKILLNGAVQITDLVTDPPTKLVGADVDGDLSQVILGTNLSLSGDTLNASGGGGGISGTGLANRLAYWTDTGAVGYDVNLKIDTTNEVLSYGAGAPTTAWINTPNSTTKSGWRVGSMEAQSFGSLNNVWIADNIYYNTAFKYRQTGPGALFYFENGGFDIRTAPSGTAGNNATLTQRIIVGNTGTVTVAGQSVFLPSGAALTITSGVNNGLVINKNSATGTPITISVSGSGANNIFQTAYNSNLSSGQDNILLFGKAGSTNNSGYIKYVHSADGSTTANRISLGFFGNDDKATLYTSGNMGLGISTATPAARLDVRGSGATSATSALEVNNSNDSIIIAARNDRRVGINTAYPQRDMHIQGEARISDLTTDTPTRLIGADADGDLGDAGSVGSTQIPYGGGNYLTSEAALSYTEATNTLTLGVAPDHGTLAFGDTSNTQAYIIVNGQRFLHTRGENQLSNSSWFLGYQAGNAAPALGNTNTFRQNMGIGYRAGAALVAGNEYNTFIGNSSGAVYTGTGDFNTAMGAKAFSAVSNNSGSNTAVGYEALGNTSSPGPENTAFGNAALRGASITGGYNTAVGSGALGASGLTSGEYNVAAGRLAGGGMTTGSRNVVVGTYFDAGLSTGGNNVIIGYNGASGNRTGDQNVIIGRGSDGGTMGSDVDGCVIVGYLAGTVSTVDNRLYLENSNTETPLVGGHFDNNYVGINTLITGIDAALEVTGTGATSSTMGFDVSNSNDSIIIAARNDRRVGINTATPDVSLDAGDNTDQIKLPGGTTAQRAAVNNSIRYNSDVEGFEARENGVWFRLTSSQAPSIAAGAAAGTTPTVAIGAGSNDLGGTIEITTGTSTTTGTLATITYGDAFDASTLTGSRSAAIKQCFGISL